MSSQRKGRRAGGAGTSGSAGWLAALAACLAASLTGCQLAARVQGPVSLLCVFRGKGGRGGAGGTRHGRRAGDWRAGWAAWAGCSVVWPHRHPLAAPRMGGETGAWQSRLATRPLQPGDSQGWAPKGVLSLRARRPGWWGGCGGGMGRDVSGGQERGWILPLQAGPPALRGWTQPTIWGTATRAGARASCFPGGAAGVQGKYPRTEEPPQNIWPGAELVCPGPLTPPHPRTPHPRLDQVKGPARDETFLSGT